jgi:outer membrane protein assembly factor BamB
MPIDGHRIFWMTAADRGRYILLSTKLGDGGELMCWDTGKQKMIYRQKMPRNARPGPIVEALPGGMVMGHGGDRSLYGLSAATGKVIWQIPVPALPVTAFSSVRRHAYEFRRGPDGHIWTFFDNVLVRIDPRDASVMPVGRLGQPSQVAFTGGRVYIAGGSRLVRIKGLVVRAGQ